MTDEVYRYRTFGPSPVLTENKNQGMNDGSTPAVPWRVSQSEVPTVLTGQRVLDGGVDAINWGLVGERVTFYVNSARVAQVSPNNRYQNAEMDVQVESGITAVFVSYDTPENVALDVATAKAGGSTWAALWTQVTLNNAAPQQSAVISGNPTGLRFVGTGRVVIAKM